MIHIERQNRVVILRMENGKVGALDLEFLQELREKLAQLHNEGTGAVVLTGTGSSFSAGVDLYRVLQGGNDYLRRFLPALEVCLRELLEFPRPIVAAVNGHAIAGGCVIVCACDHRIMAEGTGRIGVTELLVGVPFPDLLLEFVRERVASHHFQNIVYSGRTFSPFDALQVGLVDELASAETLLAKAIEVASRLAAISQQTFAITKAQIRRETLERAARYTRENEKAILEVWSSAETHDRIEAYLKKTIRKSS
jgi:enoyl-CoA hydratase